MNQLTKGVSILFLASIVGATIWFCAVQYNKSHTLDETLISNLTTRLDVRAIDQSISNISPETP